MWSWFKFNNLEQTRRMVLKCYTSVTKMVKTKFLGANFYVCSKIDFIHCLKLPQCSMFGINDVWLFAINYLPQSCHKLSKARHNNYAGAFQKLSKGRNWNCPSLQQLQVCVSIVPALGVDLFDYIVDESGESARAWLGKCQKGDTLPQLSVVTQRVIWL